MRILSITAGAANMYCGSCLRDNSLAAALIAQGHDVILLPLYTPLRTDEPSVSHKRVFFGGISIYLELRSRLFRRTPKLLDRIWDSPAVISAFAGRGLAVDPTHLGALTVSMLEGLDGHHRKEVEKLTDWLRTEPAVDLVTLPYTLLIALARPLREATGRPVVCSLQGEELFVEGLPEPFRRRARELIRAQTGEVDAFIAVSQYGARFMAGYLGIPERKIHTVPLGITLAGHDPIPKPRSAHFRIGYLARIAPEKGLHLLADAYRILRERGLQPSSLEAAGYLAPEHKPYLASVENKMAAWGLAGEFRYHGEVDRPGKLAFLKSLDVLSVPCVYDEPKGLFLLEAMANAVPAVQPRRGSFPEMIQAAGGGLLVDPDSPEALAEGISRLWEDPVLAERLGRAGAESVHRDWGVDRMADRTLAVYRSVAAASAIAP